MPGDRDTEKVFAVKMNWNPVSLGSPLSPLSPLSSPTLGNFPSKLRNRVPTQMRRMLPIYLVCVALFVLIFKAQVFPAPPNPVRRPHSFGWSTRQKTPVTTSEFPRKIWQSWKVNPFEFDKRELVTARTWPLKNPRYRYEVLTDDNDLRYVEEKFGPEGVNRLDIVDFYRSVNATIIKADLLRYMIMYVEGGVYADIDVEALKPVSRFIPARYNEADIDMVIGVEIDQPEFRNHPILGPKSMSFCQWTFMSKPGLPVMLQLIENIMVWLSDIAYQQRVPISEVHLDFDQVISGTGPSAFTAAILTEMNKRGRVTWDHFHGLDESKLVSRVLVLDVEKFAAGQGHSDSGNHNSRGALVKHHYHASNWPSKHPRFKHPAYGEVERCNWDAECVKKWDENVKKYETLTPEEQAVLRELRKKEIIKQMQEGKRRQEQAAALERLGQAEEKRKEEEARAAAAGNAQLPLQRPPAVLPQGVANGLSGHDGGSHLKQQQHEGVALGPAQHLAQEPAAHAAPGSGKRRFGGIEV